MNTGRLVVAIWLTLLCGSASATPYTALYSFGDSNSDSGRRFQLEGLPLPPYYQGRHSNGPAAVETLAADLSVSLTNFAVGGAFSGHGNIDTSHNNVLAQTGLLDQLNTFVTGLNGQQANPNALYFIWGGANDFNALGANPTNAQLTATTTAVILNTEALIQSLSDSGAHHFFVVDRFGGAGADFFNISLLNAMQSFDLTIPGDIKFFDARTVVLGMRSPTNPYGFTHLLGSDPCYLGSFTSGSPACVDPDHYVTWDTEGHLTAKASAILGNAMAAAAVPEPNSFLLLAVCLGALALRRLKRSSGHWAHQEQGRE